MSKKRICVASISALVLALGFAEILQGAATPIGLIGGRDPTSYYASFVREDGTLIPIEGLPTAPSFTAFLSASMSEQGFGLVGGGDPSYSTGSPYAVIVNTDGSFTPLNGLPGGLGLLQSVSIQGTKIGLVGGELAGQIPYAAFISPDGTSVMPITLSGLTTGSTIVSVAVNQTGWGLIGGGRTSFVNPAYLSRVSPDGSTSLLLNGTISDGIIRSVALNNASVGLVGGEDNALTTAYAALITGVSTSPVIAPIDLSGLASPSSINFVAINGKDQGVIAGIQGISTDYYAALVELGSSVAQELSLGPTATGGYILSVAINDSNEVMIGGYNSSTVDKVFAVRVSKDQVVTPIQGLPTGYYVRGAAINDEGIGLIGGYIPPGANINGYAFLVAPDGTATALPGPFNADGGALGGVALNTAAILNLIAPKSIGSYLVPLNTQLGMSFALESHLTKEIGVPYRARSKDTAVGLLVSADDFSSAQKNSSLKSCEEKKFELWANPFGNFIYQKSDLTNPSMTNAMGGFLTGLDYKFGHLTIGGGLGFAYNAIEYGSHAGHGNVQEEVVLVYGAYGVKHLWMNVALWGGIYQSYNKRFTLSTIPSEGNTSGWLFTPHIEIAMPFHLQGIEHSSIEPFFMVDWVNSWQKGFQETGTSGLNLVVPDKYISLLRTEVGMRHYETFVYSWGKFVAEEKLSYVNQNPSHVSPLMTSFIGSTSTFPVAVGNEQIQNMVGAEFRATIVPDNWRRPYVSLDFQGEWGRYFQSYYVGLEVGKTF